MNSADGDRATHPLFQTGEGGATPTSALNLFFHRTDRLTFCEFNLKWHSRLPKIGGSQGRVFYLAEYDWIVFAVAMWSNPVARMLPQLEWLELRRFAIADDAPKNTASRMLAWMARDIHQLFPNVVKLISYQDIDVHKGTIYKAAGWEKAFGYVSQKPGNSNTAGWASRCRTGKTFQPAAPRMRWEKTIVPDARPAKPKRKAKVRR